MTLAWQPGVHAGPEQPGVGDPGARVWRAVEADRSAASTTQTASLPPSVERFGSVVRDVGHRWPVRWLPARSATGGRRAGGRRSGW